MKLDNVMEQAIAAVIGGIALLMIAWAWRKFDVGTRIRRQANAAKASERETEKDQLAVMREQVVEVARGSGIVVPLSVQGTRPQVVTFSDGGVSYFCGDLPTYKRIMSGPRRTDPQRSFPGTFPTKPVSHWGRPELETWLGDHTRKAT